MKEKTIKETQIYPVGGGKGGIGKSMITANIGTLLARKGKRVLLIDLDLGSSNLHTFVEHTDGETGLDSFLDKTIASLDQAAIPTRIPNLFFISSRNCNTEAANLYTAQKQKIIRAIRSLDYDYVLMDLGAGTNFNMLDFFLTGNQGICIVTSEPTSIENTFNFIKAVYFRVVKQTLKLAVFNKVTKNVDLSGNSLDQSFRIVNEISKQDPEIGDLLKEKLSEFDFKFVVNQVRQKDDPSLGYKIEKVCNRHFYSRFKFLGNIRHDEKVHDSIQLRQNFITKYAYTKTANDLARIARNVIEDGRQQGSGDAG
ncbi:MAG: P-loop NTPase [Desulfobacterales bacterium]|nr:P-loop NTPase [Desulfobacterales bacterium]